MLFLLFVVYPVRVVTAYRMRVPVEMRWDARLLMALLGVLFVLNNLPIIRGRL